MNNSFYNRYRLVIAVLVSSVVGWLLVFLSVNIFISYATGLFILLPIALGTAATIIYGYQNIVTKSDLRLSAFTALAVFGVGLMVFALEGAICILMAAPIGILLTWVGYVLGFQIIKNNLFGSPPAVMVLLLLSVPAVMGFEHFSKETDDITSVTTSIEIAASPETVWKNVIAFPRLNAPTELMFKAGIAYPTDAVIDGKGVGAIRYCNFSTGAFVEPITVWDEPRLLKFDVVDQPASMKELSPYDIHPNHLHGYFVSKRGQFKLTRLGNGNTLLEGTTWYVNRIRPNFYWNIWSDYIIHTIHNRVLRHIQQQSEQITRKG